MQQGEEGNMNCSECGEKIHSARLQCLPNTEFCIDCAEKNTQPYIARMIYSHKTAGEVIIARGKEQIRLLDREYNRAR